MSSSTSSISSTSAPLYGDILSQMNIGGQNFTLPPISGSSEQCSFQTSIDQTASAINQYMTVNRITIATDIIPLKNAISFSDFDNIVRSSLSKEQDTPSFPIIADRISTTEKSSKQKKGTETVKKAQQKAIQNAKKLHTFQSRFPHYFCLACDKPFTRPNDFEQHAYSHLSKDQWPLECSACKDRFYMSKDLQNHEKNAHDLSETLFSCPKPDCDRTFTRRTNFEQHKFTHLPPEQWPLKCSAPDCKKRFYKPYNKKYHEQNVHSLHGGPRIFNCTICSKNFKDNCNLKIHIQRMHP